jgi:hypothetical protein
MVAIASLATLGLTVGCATARFDQNSYNAAQSIKIESITLMDRAIEPTVPAAEIQALEAKLSAQLAYEKGKGKPNQFSIWQWQTVASPDGGSLGEFLRRWKARTVDPSPVFVEERKQQIGADLDEILRLEGAKIR